MAEATPAGKALEQLGIPHRTFRHAGEVTSLEHAALERGQRPEQVVRSLVFRIAASEFIMVLAAGSSQVSWKKLREYVSQSRLTLATAEQVLRVTGYRIGTVSPFGLPQPMRVLIDRGVLHEHEVSIGSGEGGAGIIMLVVDLLRALPEAEKVQLLDSA
jgi:Cys-tRNA(Pro)/Cys-tRNA(Cys) deacylase